MAGKRRGDSPPTARRRLTTQLSVRLTEEQREYVRRAAKEMRDDGDLAAMATWADSDVLRAIVQDALERGYSPAAALRQGRAR